MKLHGDRAGEEEGGWLGNIWIYLRPSSIVMDTTNMIKYPQARIYAGTDSETKQLLKLY